MVEVKYSGIMYHIVVSFEVRPDHRKDFIAAALDNGNKCLAAEPGTKRVDLVVDDANPNRFYLDEDYSDAKSFDAHAKGAQVAMFLNEVKPYVDGPTLLVRGSRVLAP